MSKFYNNVKSRLNKKGIKGFTKADYLLAAEHLEISNLDNVTTEQIIAGVNYLMSKQSSELVSIEKIDASVTTLQTEDTVTEPVDESSVNSLSTSDYSIDFASESQNEELVSDTERMQAMPTAVNYAPTEINQNGQSLAIQDKAELVVTTAQSMGITLQLGEVENIASNLDYSGDSLDEAIGDIRSAITTFVEYKSKISQQKINQMIGEVRATVNQRNQETSQHLNTGLSQIARDINQANTDFKSQVKSALKCFAIPASKAG